MHRDHAKLRRELKRLQETLNQCHHLNVVWTPKRESSLDGEVKGDTIYIYSLSFNGAMKTLRHEFLDYTVSQCIEPYRQVTNSFVALLNKQAYERKEKLVEALASLLSSSICQKSSS